MNNYEPKDNYPDYIEAIFKFNIPSGQIPLRLDVFLTNSIKNATRTKVQKAIDAGTVTVNGKIKKASYKILPDDKIVCKLMKPPPMELVPENIKLDIAYEDDTLLVVNKPAGMVTHPGFGNRYGTLVNAILYYLGQRESISIEVDDEEEIEESKVFASQDIRPGIVHRLDKNTSGLLVIAKNSIDHSKLAEQFHDRTIERFYYALVWGNLKEDEGHFEGNIARSPRDRKLFTVVKKGGKTAYTDYWVLERYDFLTLVKIKLRTGRTHQIRVHFSFNNHQVFGDGDYGGRAILYGGSNKKNKDLAGKCLKIAKRQMLHAKILGFSHPETKERLLFESELPDDFTEVLNILRTNAIQ